MKNLILNVQDWINNFTELKFRATAPAVRFLIMALICVGFLFLITSPPGREGMTVVQGLMWFAGMTVICLEAAGMRIIRSVISIKR